MKLKNIFDFKLLTKKGPEKWIIIGALAILLVIIFMPSEKKDSLKESESEPVMSTEISKSYEVKLEEELKNILSKMDGVGNVEVMITMQESEEVVLQTDSSVENSITDETDSDGGVRTVDSNSYSSTTVLTGQSGGNGEPYVIKQIYPKVAGVVVIAEGAGSPIIQTQINEAVQALFDIPAHKIKVLKAGE